MRKRALLKRVLTLYLGLFREITNDVEGVRYIKEKLSDVLDAGIAEDLETIINTVESVKTADFKMSFDPTLVVECPITQVRSLRFPWMSSAEASVEADVTMR